MRSSLFRIVGGMPSSADSLLASSFFTRRTAATSGNNQLLKWLT